MEIKEIHSFEAKSEEEFVDIQNSLKNKIRLLNDFKVKDIKFCAGVDLAYWEKEGEQYGVCSIIVIDYNTKEVIENVCSYGKIITPYVAGFLAFRELPLVVEAARKLVSNPDVFIFDGNGYLHFNNMGIATHASFFLNKPTIGVAKSYLKVDGANFHMPKDEEGSYNDIIINGEVYGRALRTRKGVKPIFISCGNHVDLETCTEIISKLINKESRLPIPVRLADLETHIMRDKLKEIILNT
jgi:deoxyribonuclease V